MTTLALTLAGSRSGIRRATAIGASANLLWSTLASLMMLTGALPPFQLIAMIFGLGALVGAAWSLARGQGLLRHLRLPPLLWLIGIGGLFGYHCLYILALRLAPPVEANLLNYLWPLLIVLFSALLPGERLRWWHTAGAGAGLAGTALLVTGGTGLSVRLDAVPGYLLAVGCAVVWAAYSVLCRRFGEIPTQAVSGFCLATAVLAGLCHLGFETTVMPRGVQGLAVLVIGLGPVGFSFLVWDYGVKHGDIKALGALCYGTPLLSTLLLVLVGGGSGGSTPWISCLLIVGGAVVASRDLMGDPGPVRAK